MRHAHVVSIPKPSYRPKFLHYYREAYLAPPIGPRPRAGDRLAPPAPDREALQPLGDVDHAAVTGRAHLVGQRPPLAQVRAWGPPGHHRPVHHALGQPGLVHVPPLTRRLASPAPPACAGPRPRGPRSPGSGSPCRRFSRP